ncbi:MAG: gliding motility-associated C-terminal domain-containing protein, partial [Ferruginibacter sp.]
FGLGEFGICGNTLPKFPLTIAIKDAVTNALVETKIYKDQFSGGFGSVAMLPGKSYNITFTDGCTNTFTHTITTPVKERYVDYSSSGQQTLLDSTAITYIYAHGFPTTGTTLTVTGGPVSAHSTKKGYAYAEDYVYPKAFSLQASSDSSLICPIYNTAPGTYYYTITDSCGNAHADSFIVAQTEVADFYFKYAYTKGCAGEAGLQYEFLHNTFASFTITDIKSGTDIFSMSLNNLQNPYSGVLNNLKATDYKMAINYYGGGIYSSLTNILVDNFTALDTIHILPYQNPALQSSSSILCNGNLLLVLSADSSKGIPPYQYEIISGPQLFPPQVDNVFQLTQKGLYRIRLTDKCGNSTASDVTVDELVFPPLSKIGNSCINGITRLTYGASSYFNYTWTKPNGNIFNGDTLVISPVTSADTGTYTISRLTTINNCTATQLTTYRLTAGARDSIEASICTGQSYTFGSRTLTQAGVYRDTIASVFCDSISILNLVINDQKKDSNVVAICKGQTFLFGGKLLNQAGIYRDTIATSFCDSISIISLTLSDYKKDSFAISICKGQSYPFGNKLLTQTGIYNDTLSTSTCDSIAIINLTVGDYNRADISAAICRGASYQFGNKLLTVAGVYIDTLHTNTCDSISTLRLTINNLTIINARSDKYKVTKGETIQLAVTPPNLNSYAWTSLNSFNNNSISNPTSVVNISSLYKVSVVDENNCTSMDSLFIQLDDTILSCNKTAIYIPKAFTPNNDNRNDFFRITGINSNGYREYRLMIYNRFGQKVFESTDPAKYWNGTYHEKPADQGSYVYYLHFICEDGKTFIGKGNVVLLR